jgi:hypothetical protein
MKRRVAKEDALVDSSTTLEKVDRRLKSMAVQI